MTLSSQYVEEKHHFSLLDAEGSAAICLDGYKISKPKVKNERQTIIEIDEHVKSGVITDFPTIVSSLIPTELVSQITV